MNKSIGPSLCAKHCSMYFKHTHTHSYIPNPYINQMRQELLLCLLNRLRYDDSNLAQIRLMVSDWAKNLVSGCRGLWD